MLIYWRVYVCISQNIQNNYGTATSPIHRLHQLKVDLLKGGPGRPFCDGKMEGLAAGERKTPWQLIVFSGFSPGKSTFMDVIQVLYGFMKWQGVFPVPAWSVKHISDQRIYLVDGFSQCWIGFLEAWFPHHGYRIYQYPVEVPMSSIRDMIYQCLASPWLNPSLQ